MSAVLTPLEWDSAFFGFPVYRLDLWSVGDERVDVSRLLPRNAAGGCVYVATAHDIRPDMVGQLERLGAVHYGSRVVFRALVGRHDVFADDGAVPAPEEEPEVFALATSSGKMSRFAADEGFRPKFKALYEKWLENGFVARKNGSGDVFCIYSGDELAGIMSVSSSGKMAKIELLAVSDKHQRRGVGRRLVHHAFAFAQANGCEELFVVTQGGNDSACSLYRSCGFAETERREIWHLHM